MKDAGGPLGLGAFILDISTAEGDAVDIDTLSMEPAGHVEMPCDALACWADPVELVEVEDACGSLDSPLLEWAVEVPQ